LFWSADLVVVPFIVMSHTVKLKVKGKGKVDLYSVSRKTSKDAQAWITV